MAYSAINYLHNPKAPLGKWVCTRTSPIGPSGSPPRVKDQRYPDFCGQCVSFVTTVCPTIPVNTGKWRKGIQVKGNMDKILPGTAIATFNANNVYYGHAAIYESQTDAGINVVDQWVTGSPQAIHRRLLRFGAKGLANNGDNFYVVD